MTMVELVRTQSADGINLEGVLRTPADGEGSRLPVDIVIVHHGVGGSFYRESFQEAIGDALLARGCAVLRVNNRGHDLAYNAWPTLQRIGAAFETIDDCRDDWRSWIDVAEARGYRRIGVWGHSLGAVKTIYYLAKETDPRIARAIATSPPRFSHSEFLSRPDGALFGESVAKAQALVDAGTPDALFAITIPTSAVMTPHTFLDKYGPEERYDIMALLPEVTTPLLVTIGGLEGIYPDQPDRFGFGGSAERVAALAAATGNFTFSLIEGADHQYNDRTDELWACIEGWLSA